MVRHHFPEPILSIGAGHVYSALPVGYKGESLAKMYISNWSDYEAFMMDKFGKDLTPHRVKYRTLKR